MEKKNRRFASEDILAIEELAEQLSDELNMNDVEAGEAGDVVPINEDNDAEAVLAEAEQMLADAELPDDQKVVADHDVKDILDAADDVEKDINAAEEREEAAEVIADAEQLEKELDACTAGECPECGKEPCQCKKASEVKPGIEDKIGDEANGGDPSVSDIVDNDIDTATDKEVYGQNTDSEYVAKITARLDRVANALEKRGMKKMAFRVDQLSDRLEASIRK